MARRRRQRSQRQTCASGAVIGVSLCLSSVESCLLGCWSQVTTASAAWFTVVSATGRSRTMASTSRGPASRSQAISGWGTTSGSGTGGVSPRSTARAGAGLARSICDGGGCSPFGTSPPVPAGFGGCRAVPGPLGGRGRVVQPGRRRRDCREVPARPRGVGCGIGAGHPRQGVEPRRAAPRPSRRRGFRADSGPSRHGCGRDGDGRSLPRPAGGRRCRGVPGGGLSPRRARRRRTRR